MTKPLPPSDSGATTGGCTIPTARIVASHAETHDTTTLQLAGLDAAHTDGGPGQFVMVALPNHPAAAISVSNSDPA